MAYTGARDSGTGEMGDSGLTDSGAEDCGTGVKMAQKTGAKAGREEGDLGQLPGSSRGLLRAGV